MAVHKTITRKGHDGFGRGKTVSWTAIVNGKAVHGFATKRDALAAVAA